MKKNTAIFVVVVMIFSATFLQPAIPVVDWSALTQRVLMSSKTLAQWYQYIQMYKQFHNEFMRYRYAFMTIHRGFKNLSSVHDLFVNINRIENLIQMVYYDQNKIDTWSDIFRGLLGLETKYKALSDTAYMKESYLYRNPNIKKQVDQAADNIGERLVELDGQIELAKAYRQTEKEVLKKIALLQEKIGEYASEGGETNDTTLTAEYAKLMYINGLIRLENLRVEAEIASLLRMNYELKIKEATRAIDSINTTGRLQAEEVQNISKITEE